MSIMGKEFDEAAAMANALLAKLNAATDAAKLRETLAMLHKAAENLLEITENLKRRIQ